MWDEIVWMPRDSNSCRNIRISASYLKTKRLDDKRDEGISVQGDKLLLDFDLRLFQCVDLLTDHLHFLELSGHCIICQLDNISANVRTMELQQSSGEMDYWLT